MTSLPYQQLIWCSSQKSIITGAPGFGVRTKSAGLTDSAASEIFSKAALRYELPVDAMATAADLERDPMLEKRYAPIYAYKKVALADMTVKYLLVRVIYVAADYGFFLGLGSANRVGSNYIAHALVFDQDPGVAGMAAAMSQGLFLPSNTLCAASNAELLSLLAGDPAPLPQGTLEIEGPDPEFAPEPPVARVAVAMMQAYANRKKGMQVSKVLALSPADDTESLICGMADINPVFTQGMLFTAGQKTLSSIPADMQMAIIDKANSAAIDSKYYICCDTETGDTLNIDSNPLFARYVQACEQGRARYAADIAGLFANMTDAGRTDYEQQLMMLTLATTDEPLHHAHLDPDTLNLIMGSMLPQHQAEAVRQKVKDELDRSVATGAYEQMADALRAFAHMRQVNPQYITNVSRETIANVISNIFLNRSNFSRLCAEGGPAYEAATLVIAAQGPRFVDDRTFFDTLIGATSSAPVWHKFLEICYGAENYHALFPSVSFALLHSDMPARYTLAAQLYPVRQYTGQWMQILAAEPVHASQLHTDIEDAFIAMLEQTPLQNAANMIRMSPEMLQRIDMQRVATALSDKLYQMAPTMIDFALLSQVKQAFDAAGLRCPAADELLAVSALRPVERPSERVFDMAMKMNRPFDYTASLFAAWIAGCDPTADKAAALMAKIASTPKEAARLLDIAWEHSPEGKRQQMANELLDKLKFDTFDTKAAIAEMTFKPAKEFMQKNSGALKSMMRKVSGWFSGGKIGMLILMAVSAMMLASCSGKSSKGSEAAIDQYASPYMLEQFGYEKGAHQVAEQEYNGNHQPINLRTRRFDRYGRLIFESKYGAGMRLDSITYRYAANGKLTSIKASDGSTYAITHNGPYVESITLTDKKGRVTTRTFQFDGNRLQTMTETPQQGDATITQYTYDDQGRLAQAVAYKGEKEATLTQYDPATSHIVGVAKFANGNFEKPQSAVTWKYDEPKQNADASYVQVITQSADGKKKSILESKVAPHAMPTYELPYAANGAAQYAEEDITVDNAQELESVHISYLPENLTQGMRNKWILWVLLGLTFIAVMISFAEASNMEWFGSMSGKAGENGMKRMWMFNKEPYANTAIAYGLLIVSFLAAVIVLLLVGGVVWLLLWLVKLLLLALVFVGWIALILGGAGVIFAKSGWGCLSFIIGLPIVFFQKTIDTFGDRCVNAGLEFWNNVNVFNWTVMLFTNYWHTMLIALLSPLIIFAVAAGLVMLFVLLLMGIEKLVMKIYGVRRPCPKCGYSGEMDYYVDMHTPHPVALRPGMYGVFSQVNPTTGITMPTMLLNGKGALMRKCPNCQNFINSDDVMQYGADHHIGVVGHRSSGKSYLLYTMLGMAMEHLGDRAVQVDAESDTDIKRISYRISTGGDIQTSVRDDYRAVQLMVKMPKPHADRHLYFYDVAGEKFSEKSAESRTGMEFYKNVEEIIFLIDPAMVDYAGVTVSPALENWLAEHETSEKFSLNGILSTFYKILEDNDRKAKKLQCTFVCVKADTGYLEACGYNMSSPDTDIKEFICKDMGLRNLVKVAENNFKDVYFDALSVSVDYKPRLTEFVSALLATYDIEMD